MRAALGFLLLLAACPKPNPPETTAPETATPTEPTAETTTWIGRKSVMVMQHPISPGMGPGGEPVIWYLDVNGAGQRVIYSKTEPDCAGEIKVTGRVETLTASKGGTEVVEQQLHDASWTCQ